MPRGATTVAHRDREPELSVRRAEPFEQLADRAGLSGERRGSGVQGVVVGCRGGTPEQRFGTGSQLRAVRVQSAHSPREGRRRPHAMRTNDRRVSHASADHSMS